MESPSRARRKAAALAAIAILALPSVALAQTGMGGVGIDTAWGPPESPVHSHLLVVAPRDWLDSIGPLMAWRERTSDAEPRFLALEDASRAPRLRALYRKKTLTAKDEKEVLSLFAAAEVVYMTYHLDWTVFLFAHTIAEVLDLVAFVLVFAGAVLQVAVRRPALAVSRG